MNYADFQQLQGQAQLDLVGQRGVLLMQRYTSVGTRLFYRMRNFFVEVRLSPPEDGFLWISAFTLAHPQFLELMCLLPAATLRSISEKAPSGSLSFLWN